MFHLGKKKYYILIILLFHYVQIETKKQCEEAELCVPLTNCLSLNRKLYETNLTNSDIQGLRNAQCGYMNRTVYVCCKTSLPKPPICGPISLSPRVVGGEITGINEFPWTVLIGKTKENGSDIKFSCGGSLISNRYVVTAAHCIKIKSQLNEGEAGIRRINVVRLGEWNLTQEPLDIEFDKFKNITKEADPVIDMDIEKLIVHNGYDPWSKFYDIALIKLARPVNFTEFIQPICLPDKNQIIDDHLTVIGWGKTENETKSNLKRYASMPTIDLNECAENYKLQANIEIDATHICAGGLNGIDSCKGDSGGPLVGHNASNPFKIYYYLAGIVSFGHQNCGKGKVPGVYTNVKAYLRWIHDNIEEDEK